MKKLVPIAIATINDNNIYDIIDTLIKLDADEVIFALIYLEKLDEQCELINKYSPYFKEKNIRVSAWIDTIDSIKSDKYQLIKAADGRESCCVCPLCKDFVDDYCEYVKKLIKETDIKKIVLEDDFRLHMPYMETVCFCDEHIKLYGEILGEKVTKEIMIENIRNNSRNKYKDAWLKGNRLSLEYCAKRIREAVDSVDKSIEIQLCAGPSTFGADGTDAVALAKILASGETPELRLIGAPYWQNGFHLVDSMISAIDFTRHQALVCKKNNITTIAEGDPYPRPRHTVPASHLETFHTIILADGNFDKIQKYVLDYFSSLAYETGYVDADIKNHGLYADIERIFKNKEAVGINLVEPFDGIYQYAKINKCPENGVINSAGRDLLNQNSFPAVFEQSGVNLIFGENARCIERDMLKNGAILDIEAAKILYNEGVDVGIEEWQDNNFGNWQHSNNPNCYEYFYDYDERVGLWGDVSLCSFLPKETCEISSSIYRFDREFIGSYFYENDNNEKFLIYNFNAEEDCKIFGLFKSYCRQKQLILAYEKLSGKKFEAVCAGNPELYTMVKKDESSLAVGLWNYFADVVEKPVIELSEEYSEAEFINCEGVLDGKRAVITSGIPAYGYCFVELKGKKNK